MDLINDLNDRLLFAIPKKGRLYEQCQDLLHGADLQYNRKNRLDIALVINLPIAIVFLPASDIPKYVSEGRIDLGITGQDMVAEGEAEDKVDEIIKLGFGQCRLSVQVPIRGEVQSIEELVGKRVVTSFEVLAKGFFDPLDEKAGKKTVITYLGGSVEAACALGLADGIIDLVESGETMRAAGLHDIHTLLKSEAVLIRNRHPSNPALVNLITSRIKGVIAASRYVLCNYNIERRNLPAAVKITPGRQAPTVSSLDSHEGWVAVSAMVEKKDIAKAMDELEDVGATDIIVFSMTNCRV